MYVCMAAYQVDQSWYLNWQKMDSSFVAFDFKVFCAIPNTLMSSIEVYFFLCRDLCLNLDLETPGPGLSCSLVSGHPASFWLRPSSVLPAAAPDASERTQTGWTPCWEQSQLSAKGSTYIHQCCRDKMWNEIFDLDCLLSGGRSQMKKKKGFFFQPWLVSG